MISISVDQDREKAGALAKQIGAQFPVVYDGKGEVAQRYGVTAIPLNVVVDQQGKVAEVIVGADLPALKAAAERLAKAK